MALFEHVNVSDNKCLRLGAQNADYNCSDEGKLPTSNRDRIGGTIGASLGRASNAKGHRSPFARHFHSDSRRCLAGDFNRHSGRELADNCCRSWNE